MELKKGYKQTEIGVLPEDWCVSKLCENTKDITDYVAAGSFASLKENIKVFDNREHAVYVRLYDLRLGLMHLNQKYVDKSSYEFLCRSNLHGGEILLANIGANVGETWIMPQIEYPATIAPNMIVIRTADTRLNNLFCYHFTHSSVGKKGITTLVGGSGHPGGSRLQRQRAGAMGSGALPHLGFSRYSLARDRLPPRVPHAGHPAHHPADPAARRRDRPGGRAALRLRRKFARAGRFTGRHLLPSLPGAPNTP